MSWRRVSIVEHLGKGFGWSYLRRLVLGRRDEVRPVWRPLEIHHGLVKLVDWEVVEQVAGLGVVLGDGAVLVAGDDVFAQVAPPGDRGLALVADNRQ